MPVAPFAPAIIGGATSIFGGLMGNRAADAQVQAQQQALALQSQIYNQTREDASPFVQNGQGASNNLAYLLGIGDPNRSNSGQGQFGSLMQDFGLDQFQADPGYQFRLGEGQKTLERSAAARGTQFSGGTLKALDRYNQDFASNEFGRASDRYNQNRMTKYGFLNGVAGQGLQGLGITSQAGQNYANQGSQLYGNMGDARAQGAAGWANAIGGAGTNLSQLLMLRNLMGGQTGGSTLSSFGIGG